MVDIEYLTRLIALAKKENLTHLKMAGVEISFTPQIEASSPQPLAQDNKALLEALKAQEQSLPPDLRADDLMNHDKILHWSGSPPDGEMPLTGDGNV